MDASVNKIKSDASERILLAGLRIGKTSLIDQKYSMEELALLVGTRGGNIVDTVYFHRDSIDPTYLVGKGQIEEIKKRIDEKKVNTVVFDINDIKPSQVKNIEKELNARVLCRTEVIIEIFSRRAKTSESKIQVELARLRYILPRLKGKGIELSRLGGGIGTRGPGETMLEKDRRHILKRISKLNNDLKKIEKHRATIRKSRKGLIRGSIVGYTNSGKSTLLSKLSKTDIYAEDRLFATLDTFTRTVFLDDETSVLLTDTVGFIRDLPSNLVASFKSTLEEIKESDFIIHCIDISSHRLTENINTVNGELSAIEVLNKPVILYLNKTDLMQNEEIIQISSSFHDCVYGSALEDNGLDSLRKKIIETCKIFKDNQ